MTDDDRETLEWWRDTGNPGGPLGAAISTAMDEIKELRDLAERSAQEVARLKGELDDLKNQIAAERKCMDIHAKAMREMSERLAELARLSLRDLGCE